MNTSEQRIKEAFEALKMPEGLKENTLQAIEAKRQLQKHAQNCSYYRESSDLKTVSSEASQSSDSAGFTAIKHPKSGVRKALFVAAACLLVAAIGIGGVSAYATETAVVGVELNPSIELGLNRFDIVIDARALNEDGEVVLEQLSLKGKNYDEALHLITQSKSFLSYVNEESFVDVYVLCDDDRQSNSLVDRGQKAVDALPYAGGCNRITSEFHHEAGNSGMGVGRYSLAQALMALDPSLTIEDCKSLSASELRVRITEIDPNHEYALHGNSHGRGNSGKGSGGMNPGGGHNGRGHQARGVS